MLTAEPHSRHGINLQAGHERTIQGHSSGGLLREVCPVDIIDYAIFVVIDPVIRYLTRIPDGGAASSAVVMTQRRKLDQRVIAGINLPPQVGRQVPVV